MEKARKEYDAYVEDRFRQRTASVLPEEERQVCFTAVMREKVLKTQYIDTFWICESSFTTDKNLYTHKIVEKKIIKKKKVHVLIDVKKTYLQNISAKRNQKLSILVPF